MGFLSGFKSGICRKLWPKTLEPNTPKYISSKESVNRRPKIPKYSPPSTLPHEDFFYYHHLKNITQSKNNF